MSKLKITKSRNTLTWIQLAVLTLAITIVMTMTLCWKLGHLEYFPIHVSKTANEWPERAVFITGLCCSAWMLGNAFVQQRSLVGAIGAGVLPFIGVVSDKANIVLHTGIASMVVLSLATQLILSNCIGWWTVVFGISNGLNAAMFPFVGLNYPVVRRIPLARWLLSWISSKGMSRTGHRRIMQLRACMQWTSFFALGFGLWQIGK